MGWQSEEEASHPEQENAEGRFLKRSLVGEGHWATAAVQH